MENKIISILLTDTSFKYAGRLNEDYFFSEDTKRQYKFIIEFSNKYNTLPSIETMLAEFPNLDFVQVEEGQEDYNMEKFIETKQKLNFKATLENAIKNTNSVLTTATVSELVDSIIEPLTDFRNNFKVDQNGMDWGKSATERLQKYNEKAENPEQEGIKTNIKPVDACIKGIQDGDLFTIAGYSGTGKSWFMLYLTIQAYLQGKSVLFYSLEMSEGSVASRLDTFAFNISNIHLDNGRLDARGYDKYEKSLMKLSEASKVLPNFIQIFSAKHIQGGLTPNRIAADVKKFKADIVFVDQLSLMRHSGKDLRMSYIETTRELKLMAQALEIPVCLAVQMNKGSIRDKEPELDGIAESNAIVENSDKVIILKRPPKDDENKSNIKIMNLFIKKARNNQEPEEAIPCKWDVNVGQIAPLKDAFGGFEI